MTRLAALTGALAASLLASCAALPTRAPAKTPVAPPVARVYPQVTLTPKLLYNVLLGEIAGERGDAAVATRYLGQAASETRDPRLARRTAEIALYGRQYEAAARAARLWLAASPRSIGAHEVYAQALLGAGHTAEAEQELKAVIRLSPPDALDNNYLAIAGLLARQPPGSGVDRIMGRLVALHPGSAHAYFAQSQLEVERGQMHAAETSINHALTLKPAWETAAVFKGRLLMLDGRAAEGAKFYRSFLDKYPDADELRLNYARYLVNVRDWPAALVQFKRVASDVPDDAQVSYATGLLALQMHRYKDASHYLEHTLSLQPGNHQVEINLGEAAEAQKDYPKAQYWYGRAAHGDSRFIGELHVALLFAKQGQLAEAAAKLASLKPVGKAQELQQVLAQDEVLSQQKHYRQALGLINARLARFPDNTDLLYARSLVELKLGMFPEHEQDLRRVLQIDPQNAEALNALGYTLTNHSTHYHEALRLIGRALKLRPGDPYIMDSLGWAYYRLGHLKKATEYLKGALAAGPDAEISAHLGEVLWERGLRDQARTVWTRALKLDPANAALNRTVHKFMP